MSDATTGGAKVADNIARSLRLSPRILYPGAAVAVLLNHRYGINSFKGLTGESLPSLAFSLLVGALLYYFYRSILHPVIWVLQDGTPIGIQTRRLHQAIVSTILAEDQARQPAHRRILYNDNHWSPPHSIRFSQACLALFQQRLPETQRAETHAFNSGTHLLFITTTIGLAFLLHDLIVMTQMCQPTDLLGFSATPLVRADPGPGVIRCPNAIAIAAWMALIVVGFVGGLTYDRNADYREAVAMYADESKYAEIVRRVLENWRRAEIERSLRQYLLYEVSFIVVASLLLLTVTALLFIKWLGVPHPARPIFYTVVGVNLISALILLWRCRRYRLRLPQNGCRRA